MKSDVSQTDDWPVKYFMDNSFNATADKESRR